MIKELYDNLPLYHFQHLAVSPIKHFISGRNGGVSKGEFGSLNISLSTDDSDSNVLENRKRVAHALDATPRQLIFARQTHEDKVLHVDQSFLEKPISVQQEGLWGIDALMTQEKGVFICITVADCVPLLFYDQATKAVAAAHAGWKGTVKHIGPKTVAAMKEAFGSRAQDILVGIGPSISQSVYEVGIEVLEAVEDSMGSLDGLTTQENARKGRKCLDLWETNRRQLAATGISEKNIEVAGICTYTQHEEFFSARRYKGKGGRFSAGIGLA